MCEYDGATVLLGHAFMTRRTIDNYYKVFEAIKEEYPELKPGIILKHALSPLNLPINKLHVNLFETNLNAFKVAKHVSHIHNTEVVMCDYERAIIHAAQHSWEGAVICCRFHFAQAVFRRATSKNIFYTLEHSWFMK